MYRKDNPEPPTHGLIDGSGGDIHNFSKTIALCLF